MGNWKYNKNISALRKRFFFSALPRYAFTLPSLRNIAVRWVAEVCLNFSLFFIWGTAKLHGGGGSGGTAIGISGSP